MDGQAFGALGQSRLKALKSVPSLSDTEKRLTFLHQDENYRLIAPDLRGFGYSSHTQDFKSSHTMGDIVQDLICILEHAGVQSAICMGFGPFFHSETAWHS